MNKLKELWEFIKEGIITTVVIICLTTILTVVGLSVAIILLVGAPFVVFKRFMSYLCKRIKNIFK